MISNKIEPISGVEQLDLKDKIMTPGFIDQHIHITGAGGKRGFSSITSNFVLFKSSLKPKIFLFSLLSSILGFIRIIKFLDIYYSVV